MSTLPTSIRNLSVGEKFELLDALWNDLEAGGAALSEGQSDELDRRVALYEKKPCEVSSWDEVKARLLKH